MLGRIRNKLKGKKGFTMVELIVVIVIILVLAAALVPQLLKYVETAKKANCQNEAATLLTQIQADYVASKAEIGVKEPGSSDYPKIQNVTIKKVSIEIKGPEIVDDGAAQYYVEEGTGLKEDEITSFIYNNGTHKALWTMKTGWEVVKKGDSFTNSTNSESE